VPHVILVVDLLLDQAVVDRNAAEALFALGVVEGAPALFDLGQDALPPAYIAAQELVDLVNVEAPEVLEVQPVLYIRGCAPQLLV